MVLIAQVLSMHPCVIIFPGLPASHRLLPQVRVQVEVHAVLCLSRCIPGRHAFSLLLPLLLLCLLPLLTQRGCPRGRAHRSVELVAEAAAAAALKARSNAAQSFRQQLRGRWE